jgi:hypothetical protein
MTVTVIRRTLWVVAVIALAYLTFAYWEWRPVELVIAAGVFVILIPVDMALAREERERLQSPFGPVRKWGMGSHHLADNPHGFMVAPSAYVRGDPEDDWRDRRTARRLPWWRRMYRRITAPWWLAAWMPLLLIPAGLWLAPIVHAGPLEDVAYISVLDDNGVYYSTEQAAIDTAHAMCNAFDGGASFRQVLQAAMLAGMRQTDAANEIGAAIGIYCAQHADLLRPRTVVA